ncbi:hypothetical protein DYBT9275_04276 [Dyadobacter sp. CECT 9275]|uniref:GAF domain-containing protein n=1 Tax=Dyadobacter helix TaxID=2822344 RepID=A0A916NDI5_9BACT|nr:hypothetical protein DYBT9275_04276 [Dyadobacter sp. CECT 9275]
MRCRVSIFILFCLVSELLSAQTIFQNLKWQDGLSAKQVLCLYKDSDGFLWIGTSNGLNRFDGAVVKKYEVGENIKSISVNAIYPIGKKDSLLIGTNKGLRIFNTQTGVFSQLSRFASLDDQMVVTIKPDDRNRLWIGATTKIYIYDRGRLFPVSDMIPAARIIQGPPRTVSDIVWDTLRGGFWVAGIKPYFIDLKKNKVYTKEDNPFHSPVLEAGKVHAIAVDGKSNVWYGSDENVSLNFWNYQKNTVDTYFELDGRKINEGCNYIFIDRSERVWISTWLFAAYVKEPGKPIKKLSYSQTESYTIGYGHFRNAIEDTDGNIWFGTINGVSKSQTHYPLQAIYQLPSFPFFLETGFAGINFINIDRNVIMACKEEGVVAYHMDDKTYKRYFVTSDAAALLRNKFMMSARAADGWWFAGEDGVYRLRNGSAKLEKFDKIRQRMWGKANFIFTDKKGKVWFQIVNDALYRYDPVGKKCDRFDGKDPNYGVFHFANCRSFIELHDGNLLFSMKGTGFISFNYETEHFSVIPVSCIRDFDVPQMVEDRKGNLWVSALGRGVVKMNVQGACLDSVDTGSGLLYDEVAGLQIDGRGNIWAAGREGLMFFDPLSKSVTKVEIDLGKTLQDYWSNIAISNGKIYAVMLDHVAVIDPFRFAAIPVKHPPHLTSVKIFGKEKINYENNGTLELEPDEDYVTFQYASLSHRDIPSLQYSFQLEGIDKDWVKAGRLITASYTNISPGTYTFKVRSTDENGKWMTDITTMRLHVKPHWWQTWWFITLCILLFLLFLYAAYRNLVERKKKKTIDETIDYFANSVYGENSVNEICWDIARNCISQLRFEDCVVYLIDNEKQRLVQKAAYGPKNPKGHEIVNPIEIEIGKGIVGTVAVSGKPLIIGDTTKDPRYIVDDEVRQSEIAVPILHDGKVIGVIDSEHSRKYFFGEDHAKALTTIASISANKIAEALAEAQAQEKEIMLLEINKMLAESQLMALRAQMNPHFVFNCLNSIQECIVTQKYGEASKYLNKFSKLFRMVLNNSGKNLVIVEEEIEVLRLYLELEQMRFEQSFSYEIITDEELVEDHVLLPSMLVQPYVENALWHGLMHKSGERKLLIEFKRISEEIFLCRIDDNGIGRKKSFELKAHNSKSKRHESKGLQISKDRLDLLKRQGNHTRLSIIDKYDDQGQPAGTLIEIELSTYLKNL